MDFLTRMLMAISGRKRPEIVGATVVGYGTASAGFNVAKPAGIQPGDLLVMFGYPVNWPGGSAWTANDGFTVQSHSGSPLFTHEGLLIATKIATDSEPPTNYSATRTGTTSAHAAAVIAIRNASYDVRSIDTGAPDMTSSNAGVTLSKKGLLIGFAFKNALSLTITVPGMTALVRDNDGTTPSSGLFWQEVEAGATGARTVDQASCGLGLVGVI